MKSSFTRWIMGSPATRFLALSFAATIGFAGLAILFARAGSEERPNTASAPFVSSLNIGGRAVKISARVVCSLVGADARAVSVEGLDGGSSVVLGDTVYWLFGDTFLSGTAPFVNAAAARSTDFDASDCVDMQFRQASGRAAPLFPITEGETTAWPEGVISLSPEGAYFYYSSVTRDSPTEWHVNAVGIGVFDERAEGERLRQLWDTHSGFGSPMLGARSPILLDGLVYVFLYTTDNRHILARVRPSGIVDPAQYEFWDGKLYTRDQTRAAALWQEPNSGYPTHNGLSVRFNDSIDRWIALYNGELSRVEFRTAQSVNGPWSQPSVLFDCRLFFGSEWPVCYSAEHHDEFSRDGGRTLYMTVASRVPYAVWLFEIKLDALE